MKPRVLIIDDEASICVSLSLALKAEYDVSTTTDPAEGLRLLAEGETDVVLLDLVIGEADGIEVLKKIKAQDPSVTVIMMTAYGSIRSSVTAIKNGAFTYLTKPLDLEELRLFMAQAVEIRRLNDRVRHLNEELATRYQYGEIVGKSEAMQALYQMIERVKDVDISVAISGESGSGKELVARAIHYSGKRKDKNFVTVNCAAIPEGLLEEEFFGHQKGAFTGAISSTTGKLAAADGGTLFLDEIGDMPLPLQGKLLRVLQEKAFSPIGSTRVQKIDVRILVATNRDLPQMIKEGRFRQDLYYRVNTMEIRIAPLRERKQDIPLLCTHFLKEFAKAYARETPEISQQAMNALLAYDYPGNVRELSHALEHAMIMANGGVIAREDLPLAISSPQANAQYRKTTGFNLKEIEKEAIRACLEKNAGKRHATALELGISDRGLLNKIQEYHLE